MMLRWKNPLLTQSDVVLGRVSVTLAVTWTGTISYEFVKRSVGGAISVTKSRKSFLLESGANVILRGCSRAVHA